MIPERAVKLEMASDDLTEQVLLFSDVDEL
jgi:hypothetical protein